MPYTLDFNGLAPYAPMFVKGAAVTLGLTAIATVFGCGLGMLCAAGRNSRHRELGWLVTAYVELIRNTPFLVQLFFVFFGLPALGVQLNEYTAAILAMTLNLGAYATEIIRAGMDAVPRGHREAAASLAMSPWQIFRYVVLPQALAKVLPALVSQIVIVMLGSAVISQISVADLTYAGSYVQSRTFRAFETYALVALAYLVLAIVVRALLMYAGRKLMRPAR